MSRAAPRILARFGPKPWMQVITCLGLALFALTAVGALLATPPEDESTIRRVVLWAVVVLCPAYAADQAVRVVHRTPTVVATEAGLAFRSILGFTPPIPWAEIAGIGAVVIGKKLYLGISLADPNASLARFGGAQRLLHVRSHAPGDANIVFRVLHLGVNPYQAAEALEGIRQARAIP